MKTYEGVFIFRRPDDDATTAKRIDMLRSEVKKLGGEVSSVTRMGKETFARTLKKQETGVYVLMAFSMDPGKVNSLVERYRRNENILRVHVVAASGDQTPAAQPTCEQEESAQGAPC